MVLSDAERSTLENWARLEQHYGAARLGTERKTVARWRTRFLRDRLGGLSDEPRPGVQRTITDAQVEEVVVRTLEETPEGGTHWSKRDPAKVVGISPGECAAVWHAFGLQPWRTETFKISPDPFLIDKIRDAVGLYLAPPAHAAVFAVDEKPADPGPGADRTGAADTAWGFRRRGRPGRFSRPVGVHVNVPTRVRMKRDSC
ncbi:helix-turn-helix domain-containing protein [Streptomyces sp. TX20-6-3]|uniref:helix-turn-helix domain-containing protein n=1 Tax=Streptomyces sp. TX20-6-3 TaxID=3028705 RepID=UPI0029B2CDED|nr:helix-turn-helix domain-containing protein [Streptomyces sp. TX20-6-3]MDX2565408.1 helix-turn-helix domain-containing protein [Streptomyces sp. TX20-6-3]